jgi:hypothetical protein
LKLIFNGKKERKDVLTISIYDIMSGRSLFVSFFHPNKSFPTFNRKISSQIKMIPAKQERREKSW